MKTVKKILHIITCSAYEFEINWYEEINQKKTANKLRAEYLTYLDIQPFRIK